MPNQWMTAPKKTKKGQEDQTAPAQDNEKRDMKRPGTAGSEDGDKNKSGNDDSPLDAAENGALLSAPEHQPHRREGTADKQVNGDIVEPPPETFDAGSPAKGMIQAAHEEHHDHAETIDDGAQGTGRCTGFNQEQHQACNGEKGTDSMGDRVADFFQNGSFRRLIEDTGIFFHDISPQEKQK